MPWSEASVMDRRREFVRLALQEGAGSICHHRDERFRLTPAWDGAKDEDTILLTMGEGPATSTLAERK
jgi:hypothetical protein